MIKKIKVRKQVVITQCAMKYLYKKELYLGQQTRRWNPVLKSYLYIKTNKIYITDLEQIRIGLKKMLAYTSEIVSFRGLVLLAANNNNNGLVIDQLLEKTRQAIITKRYFAGGITRKRENLKQYVELKKGITNIEVNPKFINQLIGLKGLIIKPALMMILDAVQGNYLIKEGTSKGINAIACGDTTLNVPTDITSVLIGNFRGKEQKRLVLINALHAIFDGIRKETLGFVGYNQEIKKLEVVIKKRRKERDMKKIYRKYKPNKVIRKEKKMQMELRENQINPIVWVVEEEEEKNKEKNKEIELEMKIKKALENYIMNETIFSMYKEDKKKEKKYVFNRYNINRNICNRINRIDIK